MKNSNGNTIISDSYSNLKESPDITLDSDSNSNSNEISTSDLNTRESEKLNDASTEINKPKQDNSYSENIIDTKTNKKISYDSSDYIYDSKTNEDILTNQKTTNRITFSDKSNDIIVDTSNQNINKKEINYSSEIVSESNIDTNEDFSGKNSFRI